MRIKAKRSLFVISTLCILGSTGLLATQNPQPAPYKTLFYARDGLRLEAYLYLPERPGPVPLTLSCLHQSGSLVGGQIRVSAAVPVATA
jgi:hypothetical protein